MYKPQWEQAHYTKESPHNRACVSDLPRSLAGGIVMILLLKVKLPRAVAMIGGGTACFVLRMVAVARHWNLPHLLHRQ